jgi:SAM-dependent methyltransferase
MFSLYSLFSFFLLASPVFSFNTRLKDTFERDIHKRINHLYFKDLTSAVTNIIRDQPCSELSLLPKEQLFKRIRALKDVIPSYLDMFESERNQEHLSPRLRYHDLLVGFFDKVTPQNIIQGAEPPLVLDVGCGAGLSTTYLLRSLHPFSRVLAVDKDPFMLALSKVAHRSRNFINYNMETVYDHFLENNEIRRVDYKLIDFRQVENIDTGTFTSVNMNFVLDGVYAFEAVKMLRSAKRLLKQKGYLTLLHTKKPTTEYTCLVSPFMEEILYSVGFSKVEKYVFEGFVAVE